MLYAAEKMESLLSCVLILCLVVGLVSPAEKRMICLEERKPDGSDGCFLAVLQEGLTYKAFLLDNQLRPVGWIKIGGLQDMKSV